ADDRIDDLAERTADDHAHSEIDDVALHRKLFELTHHTHARSSRFQRFYRPVQRGRGQYCVAGGAVKAPGAAGTGPLDCSDRMSGCLGATARPPQQGTPCLSLWPTRP